MTATPSQQPALRPDPSAPWSGPIAPEDHAPGEQPLLQALCACLELDEQRTRALSALSAGGYAPALAEQVRRYFDFAGYYSKRRWENLAFDLNARPLGIVLRDDYNDRLYLADSPQDEALIQRYHPANRAIFGEVPPLDLIASVGALPDIQRLAHTAGVLSFEELCALGCARPHTPPPWPVLALPPVDNDPRSDEEIWNEALDEPWDEEAEEAEWNRLIAEEQAARVVDARASQRPPRLGGLMRLEGPLWPGEVDLGSDDRAIPVYHHVTLGELRAFLRAYWAQHFSLDKQLQRLELDVVAPLGLSAH